MGVDKMVTTEEIAELIKECFPNCPICGSDSGYDVSGFAKNYFQCNSCRAKWMSHDLIKAKITDIDLKNMTLWEAPADGKGTSLLRKTHSLDFWKNLSPEALEPVEPVEPSKLIFRSEMSVQEIQNSVERSMAEIASWDWGSTLYGKLGPLISDTSFAEATMIRLLRAIFEQNKILIMQNELINRSLTQRQKSESKSSEKKQ